MIHALFADDARHAGDPQNIKAVFRQFVAKRTLSRVLQVNAWRSKGQLHIPNQLPRQSH